MSNKNLNPHCMVEAYFLKGFKVEIFHPFSGKWGRIETPSWGETLCYRVEKKPWICSLGTKIETLKAVYGEKEVGIISLPPEQAEVEFDFYNRCDGIIEYSRDGQKWESLDDELGFVKFDRAIWYRARGMPDSMYYEPPRAAPIPVEKKKEESSAPLPIQLTLDL